MAKAKRSKEQEAFDEAIAELRTFAMVMGPPEAVTISEDLARAAGTPLPRERQELPPNPRDRQDGRGASDVPVKLRARAKAKPKAASKPRRKASSSRA